MTDNGWMYSKGGGHQAGPVSAAELKRMAQSGELSPDDLVWRAGMEDWVPARRIKGITFPSPVRTSAATSRAANHPDGLHSTLADAQRKADRAAGIFWFLDLKFKRFVSTTIIRLVWALYLLFGSIGLVANVLRSIVLFPLAEGLSWAVGTILLFFLSALMFRVFLEVVMVVFRISEQLHEMNQKLAST